MAWMRNNINSSSLRALSTLIAVVLAIPFSWKGLTGFYTWLSPFIALNSVIALKSFVWLNIVAFLILIFILFHKRWFCHNLCPVGWSCEIVSRLNHRKKLNYKRLPDTGKWLAILSMAAAVLGFPLFIILDPLAIFNGFFSVFSGKLSLVAIISLCGFPLLLFIDLLFPGIWCSKVCPFGGIQLVIADIRILLNRIFTKKEIESMPTDTDRRYFLFTGIGLLAGATIPRILKPVAENTIRPPASVEPGLFNTLCCRCGSCLKVCPTDIIIPHTDFGNILSWMTPEISFKRGYCLETCNLCSQVCPTGAITLFDIKAKNRLFMGTAEIHLENCLLLNNKECIKCKESCKYDIIEFKAQESILKVCPVIDTKKCVGCGACEIACPENCIIVKPLQALIKKEKRIISEIRNQLLHDSL
jgi:ferredoxin-type protein NapF